MTVRTSPGTEDFYEEDAPTEEDVFEYLMWMLVSTDQEKAESQTTSPFGYVPDEDEVGRRLNEKDYSVPAA